jgi:FkbM family methyltransferase
MIFLLTRAYAFLYGWLQDRLGFRLRGLGFCLRLNRRDHVFPIRGQAMYFDHRVSAAYGRLVAGSWNEPETHLFLDAVIAGHEGPLVFVDVGASVGEFVIDVARHGKVTRVVAFEPLAECAEAVRRSAELNGLSKIEVIPMLVNENGSTEILDFDVRRPTASAAGGVRGGDVSREIHATALDRALGDLDGKVVLLIDVEGGEAGVLRGARALLRRCAPLVIFEYNSTSRKHFSLDDIRGALGGGYDIYRLTESGTLDLDFERSWNCVAVSVDSSFRSLCDTLYRRADAAGRGA